MEKRDNAVTMKGNPVTLLGAELKVGSKAPEFALTNGDLAPVSLADSAGKRRTLVSEKVLYSSSIINTPHSSNFTDSPLVTILPVISSLPEGCG